jgi:hypothetical protein
MKHVNLHAHYLRQLVNENIVCLSYCQTNDQVANIFTKSLSEARFIKLHTMLGLQEAAIMGGCPIDVISPPKSTESCGDGGGVGTSSSDGSSHFSWNQTFKRYTYILKQSIKRSTRYLHHSVK